MESSDPFLSPTGPGARSKDRRPIRHTARFRVAAAGSRPSAPVPDSPIPRLLNHFATDQNRGASRSRLLRLLSAKSGSDSKA